MKTSQIITAFAIAMTLVGCSASVDAPPVDLSIPDLPNPVGTELKGKYQTGCVSAGGGMYLIQSVTFAASAIAVDVKIHTNSSCTTVYDTQTATGSFQLRGESEYVADAQKIDYQLNWNDGSSENIYDLALIEGNVLYMGTQQGTTPTSRPTNVNRNLPFNKVN